MFDKENAFILLVARGLLSEDERLQFGALLKTDLDWTYIFTSMKRHKLFPLLASHFQSVESDNNLNPILQKVKNNCSIPLSRSRILDAELRRISEWLAEQDIVYAILKGPVLAHLIYDNPSKRTYGDIDILILKSDADKVCKRLNRQGYIQGSFDIAKQKVVPASRKDVLWCNMYIHQLYPYKKVIEQCVCIIDLQTKFFHQYGNMRHSLGNVDISETAECWQTLSEFEIDERKMLSLDLEYFLLQICLHAYVDEVSLGGVAYGQGGGLRAYCDIREVIQSQQSKLNLDKFSNLVKATGAHQPVYYILANLKDLYPDVSTKVTRLLEIIRPDSLAFMNEFGLPWEVLGPNKGRFSQPLMKRLFNNSCQEDYEQQKNLFGEPNRSKKY